MSYDIYNNKAHRAWFHNSLLGSVKMAQKAMQTIINSPTVTADAKTTAGIIATELQYLEVHLKERVD